MRRLLPAALLLALLQGCVCWRSEGADGRRVLRGAGVLVRMRPVPRIHLGTFEVEEWPR